MYSGEKLNSITHLVGAALALIGFGALLAVGLQLQSWQALTAFSIYGLTLVALYTISTLYHSFRPIKLKRLFQKLDHVSIYLLIAGTYTPYMMMSLWEGNGPVMLLIVWALALAGFLLDVLLPRRQELLQNFLYLFMGWLCVLEFDALQQAIPPAGINWLVAGGIAYTVGVVFYVLDHHERLTHAHGIWHLFVLTGSICHFISVIAYVR